MAVEQRGAVSTLALKSSLVFKIGEFAEISVKDGMIQTFDELGDSESRVFGKRIEELAKGSTKSKAYHSGTERVDSATKKMWEPLSLAMQLLVRKIAIGAPIVIRFHNDIDGSSGAYALNQAISKTITSYKPNIMWRMHSGVSYNKEDASSDALVCNNYECIERPLLIIMDFGTSNESNPGITIAKEKFDIIWLDHHPVLEGFEGRRLEHYINPWNFGCDSNYTAGFLGCMFAKTLADVDTKDLEEASFIGDYSEFSRPTENSRRIAALLDLLTSDTRTASARLGSLTPDDIGAILDDEKKSAELIAYASNRVSEMLDLAMKSVKIYKAKDTSIYVADFESIRGADLDRYPLPGRFASRLLGHIEELNRAGCLLLLHFGSFISTRMSKQLISKVDLLKILNDVHAEYPEYVDSAGGHANAASIKLSTGEMKKEILKSVVDRLEAELES